MFRRRKLFRRFIRPALSEQLIQPELVLDPIPESTVRSTEKMQSLIPAFARIVDLKENWLRLFVIYRILEDYL
jgi:hypothetical protein